MTTHKTERRFDQLTPKEIRDLTVEPTFRGVVPISIGAARWAVGESARVHYLGSRPGSGAVYVLDHDKLHVLLAISGKTRELPVPPAVADAVRARYFGAKL